MPSIKRVISLFLLLAITACVPNATMYFRPTVDIESTHQQAHCVPVDRFVLFNLKVKEQTLKVRGYGDTWSHPHGSGTEGQYVIEGKWDDIRYKNDGFYLLVTGSDIKVRPTKISGQVHHYEGYSTFNASAVFPEQNAARFDIYFPPLLVDGVEVELPVLHLKKTLWTGISPFNC